MQPDARDFYQLEKLWSGQEALAARRERRRGESAGGA
jgi:ribosomal silencing factor RsfS